MSNLTELVPPLELCQKIPAGEFEDSYAWYVWSYIDQKYLLCAGGKPDVRLFKDPCPCGMKYFYPAPTLQEIMVELEELELWKSNIDAEYTIDSEFLQYTDANPATAALKLRLKLKGIEA